MIKTIGYAFPTSDTAKRLGRIREGCFYVATHNGETDHVQRSLEGPFATVDAAEAHAKTLPLAWSRFTRRAA